MQALCVAMWISWQVSIKQSGYQSNFSQMHFPLACNSLWAWPIKHSTPTTNTHYSAYYPQTCAFLCFFPSVVFPLTYCVFPQLSSCQMQTRASLHLFLSPSWPLVFRTSAAFAFQLSEPRSSLWGWPVKVSWALAQFLSACETWKLTEVIKLIWSV